jgi:two-component system, cell cycle response regulator
VHEEAQRLSLTDPLTGLWNYRYLRESLRREVERASRFGRMLSVLALDLDRFKEVNDGYGHAAGDAVLAEFARRVRHEIREVDLAFRSGGEEFVVLLPETDARGAAIVADRLGTVVRETPFPVEPEPGSARPVRVPIPVTVSIGVAVYPDHAASGQQVLDAADDALYAAKASGRDTYRLAEVAPPTPMRELAVPAGASTPEDDLPRAGNSHAAATVTIGGAGNGGAATGNGGAVAGNGGAATGNGGVGAGHGGAASRHGGGPDGDATTSPRRGPGPGGRPADGGASSGPHPPRQSRGR